MKKVMSLMFILIISLVLFIGMRETYAVKIVTLDKSCEYSDSKNYDDIILEKNKKDVNVIYLTEIDTGYWKPDSVKENNKEDSGDNILKEKIGVILGVIRALGIIVSVGALMVIGIKTMFASVEEKSEYKQALPGYIIGAFMVFAMTSLPSLIYDIAFKFNNG